MWNRRAAQTIFSALVFFLGCMVILVSMWRLREPPDFVTMLLGVAVVFVPILVSAGSRVAPFISAAAIAAVSISGWYVDGGLLDS